MKLATLCIYATLGLFFLGGRLDSRENRHLSLKSPLSTQTEEKVFYSQASQDSFVYEILYNLLNKTDTGYYLEIGAEEPIRINNTFFFEKNFQWKGVSIDIRSSFKNRWEVLRKNPLLIENALQSNYRKILKSFPKVIDYLSLDIDGYYDTVLKRVLLSNHIFKVITIEHDSYRFGNKYKDKERQVLTSFGYQLLCPDVLTNDGLVFEDWWIHPKLFPAAALSALASLDLTAKDNRQLIQTIQALKR